MKRVTRGLSVMVMAISTLFMISCGLAEKEPPYAATVERSFLSSSYDGTQVLVIDLNVTNDSKNYLEGYSVAYNFTATLGGEQLQTSMLSTDAPEAISNEARIASGESGTVQLCFDLDGVTEGEITLLGLTQGEGGDDIEILKETVNLADVEKIEHESLFEVSVDGVQAASDSDNKDVIIIDMTFTNNSEEAAAFGSSVSLKLFQNDVELTRGYLPYNHPSYDEAYDDSSYTEVKPGANIKVREVYELKDTTSPVEFQALDGTIYYEELEILKETVNLADVEKIEHESLFEVSVDGVQVTTDSDNKDIIIIDMTFTNNSEEAAAFGSSVSLKLFQNDVELTRGYLPYNHPSYDEAYDNSLYTEVKPGANIKVREVYELKDTTSPVEFQALDGTIHYEELVIAENEIQVQ